MGSASDGFELVDMQSLRIGMYVELGMGWLSHPFPTGSFKISSLKQIEIIRGLGLEQVRINVPKSDPPALEPVHMVVPVQDAAVAERVLAAQVEQQLRTDQANQLAAEQHSLALCEKRFGETVHLYRKTMEELPSHPKMAAEQCATMVGSIVADMLGEGESAIRLLSEAAGDKSSLHPVNVTIVSLLLGKAMGLAQPDLVDLGMAALLHDVGKSKIPERVRWPEDNFTSAEYKHYQDHVAYGVQVARTMDISKGALMAIAQHHELIDGSGFPTRCTGDSMTVAARILALVNRYDNLCNPNRQSAALSPHEALALIFAQLKTRFDSVALSAFIRMMGVYPPGSVVQLIDDRYGLVVSVNSARPLKPRLIVHDRGIARHEARILDLEKMPGIGIRRSIKPTVLPSDALDFLAPRQRVCYFFERVAEPQLAETA